MDWYKIKSQPTRMKSTVQNCSWTTSSASYDRVHLTCRHLKQCLWSRWYETGVVLKVRGDYQGQQIDTLGSRKNKCRTIEKAPQYTKLWGSWEKCVIKSNIVRPILQVGHTIATKHIMNGKLDKSVCAAVYEKVQTYNECSEMELAIT